jgi:preprotein translocase subunit SecA
MSLYKEWEERVTEYIQEHGQEEFWKNYSVVEKNVYTKLLNEYVKNRDYAIKGKISELSKEFEVEPIHFVSFLDGVNDSLVDGIDIKTVELDTEIDIKVDLEKLYFNMLDAKADYLYNISVWDELFTKEKKKELHDAWKSSKTVVNENKVGRNDPCPCGSGKKYKKCCGK